MNLSDKEIILIEKYFADELDDSEAASFRKKESSSRAFSEEVKLQKTLMAAILKKDEELLKAELKEEVKTLDLSTTNNSARIYWYAVAASLSLLIIAVYFLMPTNDSLFITYYSPLTETPITRGESFKDNLYDQAMQAYSMGEYEKALNSFLSIENTDEYGDADLFIGNCLLSLEKAEEAMPYLKNASESDNEQILLQGSWFLALAHIKVGNTKQAINILEKLSKEEDNIYQIKAGDLLKKLKWVLF